jgi:glucosamine--fructose-6-phosphate aminotransferase (isomerizing)
MCGIVGYIGRREASPIILENLRRLEYRGYDSCGIATIDGTINIKKGAGTIDGVHKRLNLSSLPGRIGIGHTRWATHGAVNDDNAHPHVDCESSIAIVHNGIISNHSSLRKMLLEKGHKFSSETDTECLAHLIEEKFSGNLENAVREALMEVEGTYALIVISTETPEQIICARSESPLILGLGNGENFIGSDVTSFLQHTKKAVPLDDGEYAVVTADSYRVADILSGQSTKKDVIEIDWSVEDAQKEGYPHFMLKEIMEQPQTIINALNIYPDEIAKLAEMVKEAERVFITAAGTSLHAAMVAEYWFSQLCRKFVVAVDSSELANKGVIDDKTLVIGVTQSGETYDTLSAMRFAKKRGAKVAVIVNVIGSTATRLADHVILQGSGIEISVCATKTFTSQLVVLLRTALALGKMLGRNMKEIEEELSETPTYIEKVLMQKDVIKEIAKKYFSSKNYIYIGKGINLPSALEGALKFKEITYNHAEGMSGGMLKHGTISLIDDNFQTIAIVPWKGENRTKIESNIQEVKARGGRVICIASGDPVQGCDANIIVPQCSETISPIIVAPAYQLLAYFTAVNLGRNVDKPRALAKSVTVE